MIYIHLHLQYISMAALSAMNTSKWSIDQSEQRNLRFEAFVALNEQQPILIIQFILILLYHFYKVIYIN